MTPSTTPNVTIRNNLNIVTVIPYVRDNISELKRTNPTYMKERNSYKTVEISPVKNRLAAFFKKHAKPVTKRNKKEPGTKCAQQLLPENFYSLSVASKWNIFTNQLYINHLQNNQP